MRSILVDVKMIEAVNGDGFFSDTIIKSHYSGDIPFSPLSIFSATV
jgi:hypothetical protein